MCSINVYFSGHCVSTITFVINITGDTIIFLRTIKVNPIVAHKKAVSDCHKKDKAREKVISDCRKHEIKPDCHKRIMTPYRNKQERDI